jgi:hypothetical protein
MTVPVLKGQLGWAEKMQKEKRKKEKNRKKNHKKRKSIMYLAACSWNDNITSRMLRYSLTLGDESISWREKQREAKQEKKRKETNERQKKQKI